MMHLIAGELQQKDSRRTAIFQHC